MALNFLTRLYAQQTTEDGRPPLASRGPRPTPNQIHFEEENAMIDFELTEEHRALVQTVREFAQGEVAPHIKEWDEKQQFDPTIFGKMAELGLLGEIGRASCRERV